MKYVQIWNQPTREGVQPQVAQCLLTNDSFDSNFWNGIEGAVQIAEAFGKGSSQPSVRLLVLGGVQSANKLTCAHQDVGIVKEN